MIQLLHTPEGVRDYYNKENAQKLGVCEKVRSVFRLYGFQEIQTPAFEYFDIFNAERGSVPSRDMYKLFDRDGETLVLRPDFTPSIARCAAKYFANDTLPVRLSYVGNTYVNNNSLRGQLKENMQAGVELVGDASVDANAEAIAIVIDVLRKVGLEKFQIEIGDVRYFQGLLNEENISEEVRKQLREFIENKNHFALEELLEEHDISSNVSHALSRLPQMFGNPEDILKEARELAPNKTSEEAIDRLEELYRKLEVYGMRKYITFDLGMLGSHDYYTGIIFKGYTYGTGDSIVSGGRYDNLLAQFGKDAAAVGFGINIDILLQAMDRQRIPMEGRPDQTLILYHENAFEQAAAMAQEYRKREIPVTMIRRDDRPMNDYSEYCKDNCITEIYVVGESGGIQKYIPAVKINQIIPCPGNE